MATILPPDPPTMSERQLDIQRRILNERDVNLINQLTGDNDVDMVATALARTTTLRKLVLAYNNIGSVGAEKIAAALQNNDTLQTLYLDDILVLVERSTLLLHCSITRHFRGWI